ncbi:hypothetical protein CRUP_027021 [Coryphaenoides rupestris]|nr:hypothetical protein CRUP_027021 [Coryphaenoides rupestris]
MEEKQSMKSRQYVVTSRAPPTTIPPPPPVSQAPPTTTRPTRQPGPPPPPPRPVRAPPTVSQGPPTVSQGPPTVSQGPPTATPSPPPWARAHATPPPRPGPAHRHLLAAPGPPTTTPSPPPVSQAPPTTTPSPPPFPIKLMFLACKLAAAAAAAAFKHDQPQGSDPGQLLNQEFLQQKENIEAPLAWHFPEPPVQERNFPPEFSLREPAAPQSVGVVCGEQLVRVEVNKDLLGIGQPVLTSDLRLGDCPPSEEPTGASDFIFQYPLHSCGSQLRASGCTLF